MSSSSLHRKRKPELHSGQFNATAVFSTKGHLLLSSTAFTITNTVNNLSCGTGLTKILYPSSTYQEILWFLFPAWLTGNVHENIVRASQRSLLSQQTETDSSKRILIGDPSSDATMMWDEDSFDFLVSLSPCIWLTKIMVSIVRQVIHGSYQQEIEEGVTCLWNISSSSLQIKVLWDDMVRVNTHNINNDRRCMYTHNTHGSLSLSLSLRH